MLKLVTIVKPSGNAMRQALQGKGFIWLFHAVQNALKFRSTENPRDTKNRKVYLQESTCKFLYQNSIAHHRFFKLVIKQCLLLLNKKK